MRKRNLLMLLIEDYSEERRTLLTNIAEARISRIHRRTATTALVALVAFGLGPVAVPSANAQTESVLYSFKDNQTDGAGPEAGVIMDKSGNLYGTTSAGTGIAGGSGYGTVFKLTSSGERPLYSFTGPPGDGVRPDAVILVRDKVGNFYGTTSAGGAYNEGTVFKVSPSGIESVLYNFPAVAADNTNVGGATPFSGLVMDSSGNLYGTTVNGGPSAAGTAFELTPSGTEIVLHNFSGPASGGSNADGAEPFAPLTMDKAGNLYGTTELGGAYGLGTVFKLTPSGGYSILHNFSGSSGSPSDGTEPYAGPLVMDKSGNLYGTTAFGGTSNVGTVFEISASGAESLLYSFTGLVNGDGEVPYSGLLLDGKGNFYGTTYQGGDSVSQCGTVFKLTPSGVETVLHRFTGPDGCHPYSGALIVDSKGKTLYGTTSGGGSAGAGTVFSVTP